MSKSRREGKIHEVKHGRVKLLLKLRVCFKGQGMDPKYKREGNQNQKSKLSRNGDWSRAMS